MQIIYALTSSSGNKVFRYQSWEAIQLHHQVLYWTRLQVLTTAIAILFPCIRCLRPVMIQSSLRMVYTAQGPSRESQAQGKADHLGVKRSQHCWKPTLCMCLSQALP